MQTQTYHALIDGAARDSHDGGWLDSTNPATGEVIGRFPRCTAADVADAAEAASRAFVAWSQTSPQERAAVLHRIADVLEANADELVELDVIDNGSPRREMRKDVGIATAQLRYFAGLVLELRGETVPGERGRLNYTLQVPWGVVGRIIPFNHPLMFVAAKIAAPLAAGNTVIVKPSEHTSLSALRLGELIADVVPAGVVNIVPGLGTEAGDALVADPRVRRLAFIGSVAVGRAIQQRAAESGVVKYVTLELGGKNPIVVYPDADLDAAVDGALRGMAFTWQSQSCGSTSRLLVASAIHDEFVAALDEKVTALRPGPPGEEDTDTGAIVNREQLDKVLRYVDIGREEGATLVTGGTRVTEDGLDRGLFVRPAVFDHVEPDSRLAQEEIFGPVLSVIDFSDHEDAIRIANSVDYGLTASVFTNDLGTAHRFARDVQAGFVWVNDAAKHFPGVAFGGVKDSGIGREEGPQELYDYSQTKNVNVNFGD